MNALGEKVHKLGMHMVTYALHDMATLSNNRPYIAVPGMLLGQLAINKIYSYSYLCMDMVAE